MFFLRDVVVDSEYNLPPAVIATLNRKCPNPSRHANAEGELNLFFKQVDELASRIPVKPD